MRGCVDWQSIPILPPQSVKQRQNQSETVKIIDTNSGQVVRVLALELTASQWTYSKMTGIDRHSFTRFSRRVGALKRKYLRLSTTPPATATLLIMHPVPVLLNSRISLRLLRPS